MTSSPLKPNSDPHIGFPDLTCKVVEYYTLDRDSDDPKLNPTLDKTPAHTFEIGLVLGGTVSAGCYTAGVLDFLIEALDAWTVAKDAEDADAPQHKVKIKIIAGTSGGGINAVLLARALGFAAQPYSPNAPRITNLLRTIWVDRLDITGLLEKGTLGQGEPVSALLCAESLSKAAMAAAIFVGPPLGTNNTPQRRNYVEPYLPVVLTTTNLRGVPYAAEMRGNTGRKESYVEHTDQLRFLVNVTGSNVPIPPATIKPDETWIDYSTSNGPFGVYTTPWGPIMEAARATSAFPVGLPPIVIHRNVEQYRYRFTIVEDAHHTPEAVWMKPQWPYLIAEGYTRNDPYEALCVDGGVFNNEPFTIAHDALAGPLGSNPRTGATAKRAVLLIDPFSDSSTIGPYCDDGVWKSAGALLGALVSGARYQTADFSLFTADDVYSRFLVTAIGEIKNGTVAKTVTGGAALASAGLDAFLGFMSRDFREHDFLLGRRNCQQFLRQHFTLKSNNPVFTDPTPDDVVPTDRPIIPLMGSALSLVPPPDWPAGKFKPETICPNIETRLDAVADAEIAYGVNNAVLRFVLQKVVQLLSRWRAGKLGVKLLQDALKEHKL
ncbi:MAG: patatin-like phospholipase family protein [Rhizomicrobium sp.]|nr:patatin-like phospholipase family protein [Rhizomicrobium sp.]